MAGALTTSQPLGARFTLPSNTGSSVDVLVGDVAPGNGSLATVATWWVDLVTGSDTNDGRTQATSLKTTEELSRRLSPGGAGITPQQAVLIKIGFGAVGSTPSVPQTQGELALNVDFLASLPNVSQAFQIQCAVSSTAPITLTASTQPVPATSTRAQIATGAGVFVNHQRVRLLNGASAGSIAYCLGLNGDAQHAFISTPFNFNTAAVASFLVGDTVAVDTLLVTIKQVFLTGTGRGGFVVLQDAILPNGATFQANATNNIDLIEFWGCELAGGCGYNGVDYFNCRVTAPTVFINGWHRHFGTSFQSSATARHGGLLTIFAACATESPAVLTCAEFGQMIVAQPLEAENGGGNLFVVGAGSELNVASTVWGASAAWANIFVVESDGQVTSSSIAQITVPKTQFGQWTGQNVVATPATGFHYVRANCGFHVNPDPTAAQTAV